MMIELKNYDKIVQERRGKEVFADDAARVEAMCKKLRHSETRFWGELGL